MLANDGLPRKHTTKAARHVYHVSMKQPRGLAVFAVVLIAKFVERREGMSNAGQPPTPYGGLSSLHNDSRGINGEIKAPSAIITEAFVLPFGQGCPNLREKCLEWIPI